MSDLTRVTFSDFGGRGYHCSIVRRVAQFKNLKCDILVTFIGGSKFQYSYGRTDKLHLPQNVRTEAVITKDILIISKRGSQVKGEHLKCTCTDLLRY